MREEIRTSLYGIFCANKLKFQLRAAFPNLRKNMAKNKKLTCKTGLRKNIIKDEVFKKEITLCKMLAKEHKGKCGWGKCKDCGVIPLLYKLHRGKLLEKPAEIRKAKSKITKI